MTVQTTTWRAGRRFSLLQGAEIDFNRGWRKDAAGESLTLTGLALGTGATLLLSRFLEALLFGVSARDPILLGLVILLLGSISLVASWIPAAQATRVDPVKALRAE